MEFWVNDSTPIFLNFEQEIGEQSEVFVVEIEEMLRERFEIKNEVAIYFFQGKRAYSFNPMLTEDNCCLQILREPQENYEILDFFICERPGQKLRIELEKRKELTMLDAILELRKKYNLTQFFAQEFLIFSSIHLSTPINAVSKFKNFQIVRKNTEKICVQVKLLHRKEASFEVSSDIEICEIHYLIALFLGVHWKKIQIKGNQNKLLSQGTLESNGIENGDYLTVCELPKHKPEYIFTESLSIRSREDLLNPLKTVEKGLFWLGTCENINCTNYEKEITYNSKYGVFDMHRESTRLTCPICLRSLFPLSFSLFRTHYSLQGQSIQNQEYFLAFHSEPSIKTYKLSDFLYLLIIATKL